MPIDGVDNNCNGLFEALDPDNDGFSSCEGPIDCDSTRADVNPGASELLDGVDNDCNGLLDAPGEDDDRDGWPSSAAGGADCDDNDATVFPGGAPAICLVGDSYSCTKDGTAVLHERCTDAARPRCGVGGCLGVASRVFAYRDNTCAILVDGSVKCWGTMGARLGQQDSVDENRGQTPYRMGDSLHPITFGTDRRAVELALTEMSHCALLDNGEVKCWGESEREVLSPAPVGSEPGDLGENLPAIDFGSGRRAIQIVAGQQHFCALLEDASVKCWGNNGDGQAGLGDLGDTSDTSLIATSATQVDLGLDARAIHLAAGERHTCAVLEGGLLKCWGDNQGAQLGLEVATSVIGDADGEMGDALPVVDVGHDHTVVDVAATGVSTCVLTDDNRVRCWGEWHLGRGSDPTGDPVGDEAGEMGEFLIPVNLGTTKTIERLEGGSSHVCALFDDQTAKCWGSNSRHKMAIGGATDEWGDEFSEMGENLPDTDLGGLLLDLSAGRDGMCGVLVTNEVVCVGLNTEGQAGVDNTDDVPSGSFNSANLVPVALGTGRSVLDVAVSANRSFCAVIDNGTVKCWGGTSEGILGQGRQVRVDDLEGLSSAPRTEVAGEATQVVVSQQNACALLLTGEVKCWGEASTGVLGRNVMDAWGNDPGEMGEFLPTIALGTALGGEPLRALQLSAGANFVCALLEDATVKCWGEHTSGSLGLGTPDTNVGLESFEMGDALPRVDLGNGARVKEIACGEAQVCALLESDEIKCWGTNESDSLGHDYPSAGSAVGDEADEMGDNLVAVAMPRSGPIERIVAPSRGLCVVYEDAEVYCFSDLVPTDPGGTSSPTTQVALDLGANSPIVDLAAGTAHVCALLEDGRIACWGAGADGQLGTEAFDGVSAADLGVSTIFIDTTGWRSVVRVFAGGNRSCALQSNGRLKCWGNLMWLSGGYEFDPRYAEFPESVTLGGDIGNEAGEMGTGLADLNVTY